MSAYILYSQKNVQILKKFMIEIQELFKMNSFYKTLVLSRCLSMRKRISFKLCTKREQSIKTFGYDSKNPSLVVKIVVLMWIENNSKCIISLQVALSKCFYLTLISHQSSSQIMQHLQELINNTKYKHIILPYTTLYT